MGRRDPVLATAPKNIFSVCRFSNLLHSVFFVNVPGTVVLYCCARWRCDRASFMFLDFCSQILDDYIFNNIFDVWGMDPPDRQRLLPIVYSRHEFARYVAGRQDERLYH